MNASKVVISSETREKLSNPVLSRAKRRKLREELIKECIRHAVGHACTKQEMVAAAGLNPDAKTQEYANGVGLINSMVKRGIISHDNANTYRKVWTVTEDVKAIRPTPSDMAQGLVIPKKVVVELQEFKMDKLSLVEMAKQFAWTNNSDSLREFINYVENAIK